MVENVTYNSPDGAVMGKSTTEKIAFHGSTPVVQGTAVATGTDAATTQAAVNSVIAQLQTYGFLA